LVLWIPIALCLIAMYFDLRSREIPDWLPLALVALFGARVAALDNPLPWWQHVLGGLFALILGLIVGYGDRFGGGDIKLFGAIGLWFGMAAVLPLALWIAIAGLPLAIIAAVRKQNDFAYAPAILIGVCVHAFAPDLLSRIAS
jgi:prepilin peptidase CpaA